MNEGLTLNNRRQRLDRARTLSWERFGKRITFYLPGMFSYNGLSGYYPALSITGNRCALQCDHCRGKTLETMVSCTSPEEFLETCMRMHRKGQLGVLISGGSDKEGRLPWARFIPAIRKVKEKTSLYVSVHCGLVDDQSAADLREAGVDQALIDVIGDDETYRRVCHVPFGVERIVSSMSALVRAGLPVVPHIVCGLDYGEMKGERRAIEMISRFPVNHVVVVSLMRVSGTPVWNTVSPRAEEIVDIIAETRIRLPNAIIGLGCARERGNVQVETMALEAGVNRMALPSEQTIEKAGALGLEIRYQRTCCSVWSDCSRETW